MLSTQDAGEDSAWSPAPQAVPRQPREHLGLILSLQNQTHKQVFLLLETGEPYLPISVAGRKELLGQSNW